MQGKVQPDRFSGGLRLNVTQMWDLAESRARFGRYLPLGLGGGMPPVADVLKLWPARRVETEAGEVTQDLSVRLRVEGSRVLADLDLG